MKYLVIITIVSLLSGSALAGIPDNAIPFNMQNQCGSMQTMVSNANWLHDKHLVSNHFSSQIYHLYVQWWSHIKQLHEKRQVHDAAAATSIFNQTRDLYNPTVIRAWKHVELKMPPPVVTIPQRIPMSASDMDWSAVKADWHQVNEQCIRSWSPKSK